MSDVQTHIGNLFTAELQFRLASAVRLAVNTERQPLDPLASSWTTISCALPNVWPNTRGNGWSCRSGKSGGACVRQVNRSVLGWRRRCSRTASRGPLPKPVASWVSRARPWEGPRYLPKRQGTSNGSVGGHEPCQGGTLKLSVARRWAPGALGVAARDASPRP